MVTHPMKFMPNWYRMYKSRDTDEKRLAFLRTIVEYMFEQKVPECAERDPDTFTSGVEYATYDAYWSVKPLVDSELNAVESGRRGGRPAGEDGDEKMERGVIVKTERGVSENTKRGVIAKQERGGAENTKRGVIVKTERGVGEKTERVSFKNTEVQNTEVQNNEEEREIEREKNAHANASDSSSDGGYRDTLHECTYVPQKKSPPTWEDVKRHITGVNCSMKIPETFAKAWYDECVFAGWIDSNGKSIIPTWRNKLGYRWRDDEKEQRKRNPNGWTDAEVKYHEDKDWERQKLLQDIMEGKYGTEE